MSKARRIIRYKGHVYVATSISLEKLPSGAALVAKRDYDDTVRSLYRDGDRYYGAVELKWRNLGEVDELSFEINKDTAWVYLNYIMKDGDPRKVTLNKEEVETLQIKKVESTPTEEGTEFVPPGRVIDVGAAINDISGHYVKAADMPMYYKEYVGDVASIYGRFCVDNFSVMKWKFSVPKIVIETYLLVLKEALSEQYPEAKIDVELVDSGSEDSMGCYGYLFAKSANNREVIQASREIENKIVMPLWQAVYHDYLTKRLPDKTPVRANVPANAITTAAYIEQLLRWLGGNE